MKLIDYLKKHEMTLATFGKKIGKHPQAVHKYANFKSYPRPETAELIFRETGGKVTMADIYWSEK